MDVKIEESWKQELSDEWSKDYFVRLTNFVRNEYATKPTDYVFRLTTAFSFRHRCAIYFKKYTTTLVHQFPKAAI